ncbi:A/G-specific adenine glycosylase [Brevibacterium litoralis]|uniref:A/G-specific adenine glycosylase n=1 Tax=Brevibacterium litoralis TaxID=3138935 RepID=UPI0032F00826
MSLAEDSRVEQVTRTVVDWFADNARPLPWREPGTSAWGILVSEVMSQQTPMTRVAPRWLAWMDAWPTPADLAAAPTSEVLLAWDTLGYPRRALRLQECAQAVVDRFDGEVPADEETLLDLPGIGAYTAAAVASFAHGRRTTVLDVNVRRVLSRVFDGIQHPPTALSKKETRWASRFVPDTDHVAWNAGTMELGAVVCTSRNPACDTCPLAAHCGWLAAGRPAAPARKPRTQAWAGTDRQLRGAIMKVLRNASAAGPAPGAPSDPPGTVPVRLFTVSTSEFTETDEAAAEALPEAVRTAWSVVRELGTAERISGLVADLVNDGLAVRRTTADGTQVLALP